MTFIGEMLKKLDTATGSEYREIMNMIRNMDRLNTVIENLNMQTVKA